MMSRENQEYHDRLNIYNNNELQHCIQAIMFYCGCKLKNYYFCPVVHLNETDNKTHWSQQRRWPRIVSYKLDQ